jgi:integrase/recombinase XerD
MTDIRWEHYPQVSAVPQARRWLTMQANLGLATTTIDAYARALQEYLTFCSHQQLDPQTATREHIAVYVHMLTERPLQSEHAQARAGLANATIQQRLVAVRLFYDYLLEEGLRDRNPVGRGRYTAGKGFGGKREKGLVPRYTKLPWIPTDVQWQAILQVARAEPIRNRLMLALAYDAALRREELCALRTDDLDPAQRTVRIRAESTKGRRERIVPFSTATAGLLQAYLLHRQQISRARGPLFLSESRRNRAAPLTIWTWSKVVRQIALRANVPQFSTHTLRHLCLTDLARSGWELHAIASFAGHRNVTTTLQYVHLSGRDLAEKLARGMTHIHTWRTHMLAGGDRGAGRSLTMRRTNQQQASPASAHDPSKWQWPIDLSGYDRSPMLSPEEQLTLRTLSADLAQGQLPNPTTPAWAALARLIGPLEDACVSLVIPSKPAHGRSACQAVALILHGCALSQTSFWAWDAAGWVALFGPDQRTFRAKVARGMEASLRPSMVGIAYLLDCFSSFHLLGRVNRITLATRIFGPTRVSAAIESIMTILAGWGYHSARRTDKFPGLIATMLLLNRSPDLADITPAILERLRRHEQILRCEGQPSTVSIVPSPP